MEPITAAVMLVLGCDHSMMVCRQVETPAHYASAEECRSDVDMQLRFVDFPMAVAECIDVPGLMPNEKVVIDWRIDAVGGLMAETRPRPSGPMTASAEPLAGASLAM